MEIKKIIIIFLNQRLVLCLISSENRKSVELREKTGYIYQT